MPIWGRGLSPITTKLKYQHGEFCVPVCIGGAAVEPGDAVLADENGVLFLKPHQVKAAAERAIAMQEAEGPRLKLVADGARLPDLNGVNAKIKEIMNSK
jgi:regulator of RNase E activity RraA